LVIIAVISFGMIVYIVLKIMNYHQYRYMLLHLSSAK